MRSVVGRNLDGEAQSRSACLIKKLRGLRRVIRIRAHQALVEILRKARIYAASKLCAVAVLCQFENAVDVNGIAQSLSHPLIVKRGFPVIQIERLDEIHLALDHIVAVGQAVDLIERHVQRHIQRSRIE